MTIPQTTAPASTEPKEYEHSVRVPEGVQREEYTIAVSGGFDPLHGGHIAMFQAAAALGPLTVILNSDAWLIRKKGFVFLPFEERAAIIGALSCVREVVAVDDVDGTVCAALAQIRPAIFANGGDRTPGNTPEMGLCQQLGIRMEWGVGGEKANASSDIARRSWVSRPWGKFVTLDEGEGYKLKKVVLAPGQAISMQHHRRRSEYWYMAGQGGHVTLNGQQQDVSPHSPPVAVPQGTVHCLANRSAEPLTVIEIQSGDYLCEDDIIRVSQEEMA